jgi:tricarballylate dehydrogenase
VTINSEAQVLNFEREAIPGLYAAGEIMGGFYYDNYQVITGYLPVCLVFGRIAGKNAARTR